MKIRSLFIFAALAFSASVAQANSYVENFEASFPSWESGWLGTNSNLTNYYGVGAGRGNNPDGLWIGGTSIVFNPSFGSGISSLSIDVASWTYGLINFFDSSNNLISSQSFTANYGAYTDPGTYEHFVVNSVTGISHFDFIGSGVLGNTSIDNVEVNAAPSAVPLPAALPLMLSGLGILGFASRRRKE